MNVSWLVETLFLTAGFILFRLPIKTPGENTNIAQRLYENDFLTDVFSVSEIPTDWGRVVALQWVKTETKIQSHCYSINRNNKGKKWNFLKMYKRKNMQEIQGKKKARNTNRINKQSEQIIIIKKHVFSHIFAYSNYFLFSIKLYSFVLFLTDEIMYLFFGIIINGHY